MSSQKAKISRSKIDKLQEGEKLWDAEVSGFYVHKQKTKASFYYKYRYQQKQVLAKLGQLGSMSIDDARALARLYYTLLQEEKDPKQHLQQEAAKQKKQFQEESYTIGDAYQDWEVHCKPQLKISSLSHWTLYDRYIKPKFEHRRLTDLSIEEVNLLHASIEKRYSANATIRILKKLYSLAQDLGKFKGQQPFIALKLHPEKKRRRHLTGDEPSRLYEALQAYKVLGEEEYKASACVFLYLLTSARKQEWLSSPKAWVNLEEGVLSLPDTKNGEPDEKILPVPAVEILETLFHKYPESPWIFPSPKRIGYPLKDIKRHWKNIKALAGIEDLRIHDLRRSFASIAFTNGYGLHQIGEILNHKNISTTKGYSYLMQEEKRAATEAIAQQVIERMQSSTQ